MEIIVGAIAVAFAALVIFLILTLQDTRKTLKKTDRILTDIHKTLEAISEPSADLIQSVNKLTLDIKKKSEGIDVLFRPLYAMKEEPRRERSVANEIPEVIALVAEGVRLFGKIKSEFKR